MAATILSDFAKSTVSCASMWSKKRARCGLECIPNPTRIRSCYKKLKGAADLPQRLFSIRTKTLRAASLLHAARRSTTSHHNVLG